MNTEHFKLMDLALTTESQSAHKTHKVGALICGIDNNLHKYQVSRPNYWPAPLKNSIGKNKKLGNASTTVHAEIAAICASPATEGADIYITDLPCPNCAKIIAESRIGSVYIDSHTHNTPLGLKIKPYFDDISTLIFKSAGISVYEISSIKNTIHRIVSPLPNALLNIQRPVHHIAIDNDDINNEHFKYLIGKHNNDVPFAACFAKSLLGQYSFILARSHRSIGLSPEQAEHVVSIQDKYEPTLQPINRLLLTCVRYGLRIDPNYLYSSQTPTSREFVNIIGAGHHTINIGDQKQCRDKWGLRALEQLKLHKIIDLQL